LVVGGGVIGLAAAVRLAASGARTTLVDPGSFGAGWGPGASWVAAGMLAPVSEASFGEEEITALNLAAVRAFVDFTHELATRTATPVSLRTEGTLVVAFNADDKAALDRLTDFRNSMGLVTEHLTGRQARSIEPFLATEVRAAALARDDLSVDNRQYLHVLRDAALVAGVRFLDAEVVELHRAAGRVAGVVTTDGTCHTADTVVLATGAATARLTGLPIQPVKGQILRLSVPARLGSVGDIVRHTIRGLVRGGEVYLVPRASGEVVVGATSEQRGHDLTVTAGAVYALLRNAYELLPISSEFQFVEARAGSRPGTPDNGPLVGNLEPGLIIASGHYRNGILLSALTATAVVRLVAGESVAEEWKPFDPQRFTG
jgi:glycine oxidase